MSNTIDTAMARQMVEAHAILGASIIGQPGGWSVMLKIGLNEKPLGAQRTDKPRMWRSLDACMGYIKKELQIVRLDSLDASNYSEGDVTRKVRPDAAGRLKRAHEAAAYDKWFIEQVEEGIREADDPNTVLISHEVVKADMVAQRKSLQARIAAANT
jgi:hypothetical protein